MTTNKNYLNNFFKVSVPVDKRLNLDGLFLGVEIPRSILFLGVLNAHFFLTKLFPEQTLNK